eukprot:351299-Chlamydomonas_euryale.AAC.7
MAVRALVALHAHRARPREHRKRLPDLVVQAKLLHGGKGREGRQGVGGSGKAWGSVRADVREVWFDRHGKAFGATLGQAIIEIVLAQTPKQRGLMEQTKKVLGCAGPSDHRCTCEKTALGPKAPLQMTEFQHTCMKVPTRPHSRTVYPGRKDACMTHMHAHTALPRWPSSSVALTRTSRQRHSALKPLLYCHTLLASFQLQRNRVKTVECIIQCNISSMQMNHDGADVVLSTTRLVVVQSCGLETPPLPSSSRPFPAPLDPSQLLSPLPSSSRPFPAPLDFSQLLWILRAPPLVSSMQTHHDGVDVDLVHQTQRVQLVTLSDVAEHAHREARARERVARNEALWHAQQAAHGTHLCGDCGAGMRRWVGCVSEWQGGRLAWARAREVWAAHGLVRGRCGRRMGSCAGVGNQEQLRFSRESVHSWLVE